MQQTSYFLEEKPLKLLFKFSIPCIVSLPISAPCNIVDQPFIGNWSVGAIIISVVFLTVGFPFLSKSFLFWAKTGESLAAAREYSF